LGVLLKHPGYFSDKMMYDPDFKSLLVSKHHILNLLSIDQILSIVLEDSWVLKKLLSLDIDLSELIKIKNDDKALENVISKLKNKKSSSY